MAPKKENVLVRLKEKLKSKTKKTDSEPSSSTTPSTSKPEKPSKSSKPSKAAIKTIELSAGHNATEKIGPLPLLPTPFYDPTSKPSTANSAHPFFKLPKELRSKIYAHLWPSHEAIHIEYLYDIPRLSSNSSEHFTSVRGDKKAPKKDPKQPFEEGEKSWEWYSCYCHSENPLASPGEQARTVRDPMADFCLSSGHALCNSLGQGRECFVRGAAWLRVCKEAYTDALPHLYTRKFIFTTRKTLSTWLHLPALIPPSSLSHITGLELTWLTDENHKTKGGEVGNTDRGWPGYASLLKMIKDHFPRLTSLNLLVEVSSLESPVAGKSPGETDRKAYLERVILEPVDEVVAKLGEQLLDCEISIGEEQYGVLAAVTKGNEGGGAMVEVGSLRRFWRTVSGKEGRDLGYWVSAVVVADY